MILNELVYCFFPRSLGVSECRLYVAVKPKKRAPLPSSNSVVFVTILALMVTAYGVNAYLNYQQSAQLDLVEVTEYEGEKLGSIEDFRENSIKGSQQIDPDSYRLSVTGLVGNHLNYTYDDVLGGFDSSKKVVAIHCVEGWSVKILWEGVKVMDLLEDSGVSENAETVIFHAHDGYTSSLPIAFIASNDIIMAYKMNGVTIPPERGFPFQLVAESK